MYTWFIFSSYEANIEQVIFYQYNRLFFGDRSDDTDKYIYRFLKNRCMVLGIRIRIIYDFLVIIQESYMISLVSYKDRTKKSSMDSMKSYVILVWNQRNFNPCSFENRHWSLFWFVGTIGGRDDSIKNTKIFSCIEKSSSLEIKHYEGFIIGFYIFFYFYPW